MRVGSPWANLEGELAAQYLALAQKLEEFDSRVVNAAWREYFHTRIEQGWAKSKGVKRSSRDSCIHRLFGKRCNGRKADCWPPGNDHPSLWLKDGKPRYFLYQPYNLHSRQAGELADYCTRLGLEATISTWPNFHNPGEVLAVIIERKEHKDTSTTR